MPQPSASRDIQLKSLLIGLRRGKSKSKLIYSLAGENTVNKSDVKKSAGKGEQATIGLVVSGFIRDWTSMATVKDFLLFRLGLHQKLLNIVSSR